jgi:glycosyltransferase involved in cell wall biosynthesis
MSSSSVSVVVPCYNYGRYLRDCVQSLLDQAGVDVRVLIVDDASTDNSASIAAELAAADPRVEFRPHATNQGHIRTYNDGLDWATGTYTVLLSADDMLTPGSLRRACELLDAHPEVGFVHGRALVFRDDHPRPRPTTGECFWTIWQGFEWFETRCRTTENCVHAPGGVMRTRWLRELGGFRAELPHTADFEMWMRLALYADIGYVGGVHQAFYRAHAANMHHEFGTALADLKQVRAAFETLFHDHGQRMTERARLEACTWQMLSRRALQAACAAYDLGLVDSTEIAALEELAFTTSGDAHTLAEWRGLQWRKRLGPRFCRIIRPLFRVAILPQRFYRRLKWRRLRRAGL